MDKARIDTHMKRMADNGVKVVRTWAFNHESKSRYTTRKNDCEWFGSEKTSS